MSPMLRLLSILLTLGSTLGAQQLAVTLDDGPRLAATPRLSAVQRNEALLEHLRAAKVRAALFVTVGNGADHPEGLALLRAWSQAGHALGNHTVTHPDLHGATVTLAAYQEEILACQKVIEGLPGYRPWFRFTFLREGNTAEKRQGMRSFLASKGLRNGHVTLDTSDWRLNQRLEEVLGQDPKADVEPIRQAYLDHLKQRAAAYRDLSRRLLGRDIPQVLLLHHNLINALFLGDALAMLRREGWSFVDPEVAYRDPVYQSQPERAAPGQSLLLSLARSQGWKLVPEFERLLDDGDFEIARLDARKAPRVH